MKALTSFACALLALSAASSANAEPMRFQYVFTGLPHQPFANGSILTGHFDGSIQPDHALLDEITESLKGLGYPKA